MPTTHRCLAAGVLLLFLTALSLAQETQPWDPNVSPLPAPTGFINDYAGVVDQATKDRLETKLKAFRDQTNPPVEIAVAVVRTTGDRPIFDYSMAVARGWGIGAKADDNPSALLFIAIDDRKYFTQVSRDLEDELPDGAVGSLQRQFLVPQFRAGNYGKGIEDTIEAYLTTIANKGNAPVPPSPTPNQPGRAGRGTAAGISFGSCCFLLVIVVVVLIVLLGSRRGGRGGRGGGSMGGALPWIIGGAIGNMGSGDSSSWGDGGSSWGGSDGGFGGFGGGGDFGGGGGGGDW